MRKLDLLAGNCSFFYRTVPGRQLKCPILHSFFGFSVLLQTEQTTVVVLDSFNTHLPLLQIRKRRQLSCLKKKINFDNIFVSTLSKLVPLKTK